MGAYDMLPNGSQVKCWNNEMKTLKLGDTVPYLDPDNDSYAVILREGGFVRVANGVIIDIVEDGKPYSPSDFDVPCIDKWGNEVGTSDDLIGIFSEHFNDPYNFGGNDMT